MLDMAVDAISGARIVNNNAHKIGRNDNRCNNDDNNDNKTTIYSYEFIFL
jgi:hypothetical protein